MKEFALKHPILTFLLADTLICGVVNVIGYGVQIFGHKKQQDIVVKEDAE